MSESGVGVSRAVTRQNAGSFLNVSAADALVGVGRVNPPASTDSAETIVPPASGTLARAAHAMGPAAATRVESDPASARMAATPANSPILMSSLLGSFTALMAPLRGQDARVEQSNRRRKPVPV